MSFLVDTNVFSELAKSNPDAKVVAWLRAHESALYVSAITIGEIRRGIERLPTGRRKTQLRAWVVAICEAMKGRVLSFNTSTAHVWGQLKGRWDAAASRSLRSTARSQRPPSGTNLRWSRATRPTLPGPG